MYDDFFELFQEIMKQQKDSKDESNDADGRLLIRSKNPRYEAYMSVIKKQCKQKN